MPKIEEILEKLFDFQHIATDKSLEKIIKATEARYDIGTKEYALSDDELEIFAAGDPYKQHTPSMEDNKDE